MFLRLHILYHLVPKRRFLLPPIFDYFHLSFVHHYAPIETHLVLSKYLYHVCVVRAVVLKLLLQQQVT